MSAETRILARRVSERIDMSVEDVYRVIRCYFKGVREYFGEASDGTGSPDEVAASVMIRGLGRLYCSKGKYINTRNKKKLISDQHDKTKEDSSKV